MPSVITIGEVLVEIMATKIDQSFQKPGQLSGPYPSGAPAIFIDQAALMGVEAGMIGAIGDDDFGHMTRKRLAEDGADVSQIKIKNGFTTGTAFVTYFSDGGRKFIYHFTHSAAGQLSPHDLDHNYIKTADYLHIMGCSLSGSSSMRKSIFKAIKIAINNNTVISFDPNIRMDLLELDKFRDISTKVLFSSDIVLAGRNEFKAILGDKVEKGVDNLRDKGVNTIVLKAGKKDIEVFSQGKKWSFTPFSVNEVDPTGAGDCFDGAFISAISQGYDIKHSVRYGMAAGALSVQKKGPMEGTRSKSRIEKFIEKAMH